MKIKTAIFDLDGTLLNTLGDLCDGRTGTGVLPPVWMFRFSPAALYGRSSSVLLIIEAFFSLVNRSRKASAAAAQLVPSLPQPGISHRAVRPDAADYRRVL